MEKAVADMDASGWVYTPDYNNTVRYTLGQPSSDGRNIICFGINPSTAEPNRLDPTLQSVARIARINNYSGWIMLNVYPQRATDPNDMDQNYRKELHENNLSHIKQILSDYECDLWAAWGTLIHKRKYLTQLLSDIYAITAIEGSNQGDVVKQQKPSGWVSFGKTSIAGHPHHPLYLRSDSPISDFDMMKYLKSLL